MKLPVAVRKQLPWQILFGLCVGVISCASHAVCVDPVGGNANAGQFRYMPDYKEYRHCDGTYWQSMATRTTTVSSCTAGTMTFLSNDLLMCNGTGWVSMVGATSGVCSKTSGTLEYDGTAAGRYMKVCVGGASKTVGLEPSPYLAFASTAANYTTVYSVAAGTVAASPSPSLGSSAFAIAFSPSGSFLASGGASTPQLRNYRTSDWTGVSPAPAPTPSGNVYALAFHPDGSKLAVGLYTSPYLEFYNVSTWTKLSAVTSPAHQPWSLSYNPSGSLLAAALVGSPCLQLYNGNTMAIVSPFPGSLPVTTAYCYAVAFSPNGRYLALGVDEDPRLIVYETSGWTRVSITAALPTTTVTALAWHPDSSKLAVGTYGGTVSIYNASDWGTTIVPTTQPNGEINSLSFNSRGSILAAGYATSAPYYITYDTYDWSTRPALATPPPVHNSSKNVWGVSFSPGK